jgi:uncharacterized membrane protein
VKSARFAAILFVALSSSHLAFAGFTLCNRTSQDKLIVATARTWYAQDQTTGERVIDAESRGWATIPKGSCVVISPFPIRFDDFYFFAYSAANPSIKWTGKYNFCVDPKSTFDYGGTKRVQAPCPAEVTAGMIFVDTYGDDDYQYPIFDQH